MGTPTTATRGGVLIYAKTGINFKPRDDLSKMMYKSKELESSFIEVVNKKGKNCIVENIFSRIFYII